MSNNERIRSPQTKAFEAIEAFATEGEREAGIVLPVECGKSGTIKFAPFAFGSGRTLVVAPAVAIARQLAADFDPASPNMSYQKCQVPQGSPWPEPIEIRGRASNRADLDEAHVVISNIQQLPVADNRWLQGLPPDFFDLATVFGFRP